MLQYLAGALLGIPAVIGHVFDDQGLALAFDLPLLKSGSPELAYRRGGRLRSADALLAIRPRSPIAAKSPSVKQPGSVKSLTISC